MFRNWTFGQKIAGGFAILVFITILIGVVATAALQTAVASKDRVINVDSPLMLKAAQMQTIRQQLTSSFRNVMLSGADADIATLQTARDAFTAAVAALKADALLRNDPISLQLAGAIATAYGDHTKVVDQVIGLRKSGTPVNTALAVYEDQGAPKGTILSRALTDYTTHRQDALAAAQQDSTDKAYLSENIILTSALLAALAAGLIANFLTRSLNQQIGSAVSHVQNSSAELQSAANQQATGVKEQATSMSEINITISELLATSRQIAESAQRVAQISEQTTFAARSGDGTVNRANDSISGIRRQVDLVVGHMLELGKKSQQIGAILDIVTELAEQTNILSINATIEAAGAGESGKRFSVVADEIRKLADRVGAAAKEIRELIDAVRSSVNTTVMATEIGSKAVDTGSQQFGDVATAFKEIAKLVATTTEAAREIELSTKQQATAVEQVNIAIANVAQATKETEASAGQTIQTATELASTSRDLLRLVRARTAA
ncbi:MAG TPA: methyl-accepting chemotaxis protein [Devosia sp.]|nr:methyl-accepting chemotaxis protein [Devosia sp.]